MEFWVGVVSLFPEMFGSVTDYGVTGRAVKNGVLAVEHFNPRDHTLDKHRTVDARPYGGGPGMVMMAEPLSKAIQAARAAASKGSSTEFSTSAASANDLSETGVNPNDQGEAPVKVVYLSPQGRPLTQQILKQLSQEKRLILLAGRYEGIDERLIASEVDEEISIGDYVISGGELAAMVVIDGLARLLPGVLGHELSAQQDSFEDDLLDCPHYTRPERYQDSEVPEVLLSGHHEKIRRWRLKQSLGRTWLRRPDLLEDKELNKEQRALLQEFKQEFRS